MTAATIPAERHRTFRALAMRWPTALAVLTAAVTLGGEKATQVTGLGETLLVLPLIYLVVARSGRRGLSWPVLGVSFALAMGLRAADAPVAAVLVALAAVALAWSAIGHVPQPGTVRLQALGMVGFGALALAALAVDTDLAIYLVAAGWFLHGVWDFVHLKLDRAVSRSYAEWCGVLDVLTAAYLLLLAW
jgi:hypothetical protein